MRKPWRWGASVVSPLYGKVGAVITQQSPSVSDELREDVKPESSALRGEVRCAS